MIVAAIVLLCAGGLGFLVRLVRGPTVADRVISLDGILTLTSTGLLAYGALREEGTYLVVGVLVALVAFLATATFARFIEGQGR